MTTFEEEFPELKGFAFEYEYDAEWETLSKTDIARSGDLIMVIDIKRHCLSKQKVREVVGPIKRVRGITPECNVINAIACERERILRELGL